MENINSGAKLVLPPMTDGRTAPLLPRHRQVSIVGANGAGKSRFINEMRRLCGDRAYYLSALDAFFPERKINDTPGSIDSQYAEATGTISYMKPDAISELDKLCYLLFSDEFKYLMSQKARSLIDNEPIELRPTKLDRLIMLWEHIFPGNKVLRHSGKWMFKTDAGDDIISASTLSHGEKAVLYYIGAVLYAPKDAVVFIEAPTMFLHPSILNTLWNSIESLRPDCTFVYNSVDMDFINTRTNNICIWIKSFDVEDGAWDYEVLAGNKLSEDISIDLIGTRKPVLFIEGDAEHSIDAKLYTLVFKEYTVRPLGSCNKVIESVRSFNDLKPMHHLDSHGIVDRDRRTDKEVAYLRQKAIFVPEVAEVENIFLMESVIRIMARYTHRDPEKIFAKVRKNILAMFAAQYAKQALQHVRHQMKRDVECKIDARFTCITALEAHISSLINKLRPREHYNALLASFEEMLNTGDYAGVLRVFNHKPMLPDSRVAELLGYPSVDAYIRGVLLLLKGGSPLAEELRSAIKGAFNIDVPVAPAKPKKGLNTPPTDTAPKKKEALTPRQKRRLRNKRNS